MNGYKIKNYQAASIYEYNLGVRDRYDFVDAVFPDSLLSRYMLQNGMKLTKSKKCTRDVVCVSFDYGSPSFEEKKKQKNLPADVMNKILANKDKFCKMSYEDIRIKFYEEGFTLEYIDGERIHYSMLYRTGAKGKMGEVMFINSNLFECVNKWMSMGTEHTHKVVEYLSYKSLSASAICDTITMNPDNVLILKDAESVCSCVAKQVMVENGECVVKTGTFDMANVLWDGMALIESAGKGMILLRNLFFKACALKTKLQLFFQDWCKENNVDYDTFELTDMFGVKHLAKQIRMITTDKAIKWLKFSEVDYLSWIKAIKDNNSIWGVVKTDHPSKLGMLQQLSYQMVNSLPCTKEDINELAENSKNYLYRIKQDNDEFEIYLRANANFINHYEMLADLYAQNHEFVNTVWFKSEKKTIISNYSDRLKKGKITVNGDNLTLFGNPYGLLMYAVGDDYLQDTTLQHEEGVIQCYTTRFNFGDYLCAIRNPHNSPNNVAYLHNVYSAEMEKYFNFSDNIIAINGIKTDIQSRLNGCDYDSDFSLVTNNEIMVKCAKECYQKYPTIINGLKESGLTYENNNKSFALIDNKCSKSRMGIGWSSNLAQLSLSYYWTTHNQAYYNNFVILSVIAQIIIDSVKRSYEVDGMNIIKQISNSDCMKRFKNKGDLPVFMKLIRIIPYMKNGKMRDKEDISTDRNKLNKRINTNISCPMNWLSDSINKVSRVEYTKTVPTENFLIKMDTSKPNYRLINRIYKATQEYSKIVFKENDYAMAYDKAEDIINNLKHKPIKNINTMNYMLQTIFKQENEINNYLLTKENREIMNLLYHASKENFLANFTTQIK